MSVQEFTPQAGVMASNKAGKPIIWFRGKDATDGSGPFFLLRTWPERADSPEDVQKLKQAVGIAKAVAARLDGPLYDFAEVEPQLEKYSHELGEGIPDHPTQDDIFVNVTDLVTGRKHRMCIGVSKQDLKP